MGWSRARWMLAALAGHAVVLAGLLHWVPAPPIETVRNAPVVAELISSVTPRPEPEPPTRDRVAPRPAPMESRVPPAPKPPPAAPSPDRPFNAPSARAIETITSATPAGGLAATAPEGPRPYGEPRALEAAPAAGTAGTTAATAAATAAAAAAATSATSATSAISATAAHGAVPTGSPAVSPTSVPETTQSPRVDASWQGNVPPPYPLAARRKGEAGTVRLDLRIESDGSVSEIRLRQSSGSALLDRSVMQTVRHWRFVPARQDGRAVAAWYTAWEWVFRLESGS